MTATYYGTTAGTTLANPPLRLTSVIGGQISYVGDLSTASKMGATLWLYNSTNTAADMAAVGVIVDGVRLGIRTGDILIGVMNGGSAVVGGHSTSANCYMGMLMSTESSITTGACRLSSNVTTGST